MRRRRGPGFFIGVKVAPGFGRDASSTLSVTRDAVSAAEWGADAVATRHARSGFGQRGQRLSVSAGKGGGLLEAFSSEGVGKRVRSMW